MNTMKTAIAIALLALSLALSGCVSSMSVAVPKTTTISFAPAVAEVSGVLVERHYLSVMEGSPKEMIDGAIVIVLDRPVDIVSGPELFPAKADAIQNVKEIEIANQFDFDFRELSGQTSDGQGRHRADQGASRLPSPDVDVGGNPGDEADGAGEIIIGQFALPSLACS